MFKNKTSCPNCLEQIDCLDVYCPNCQKENTDYKDNHLSKFALNVSFAFQIIFFVVGWLGFQILSFLVEITYAAIFNLNAETLELSKNLGPIMFITYSLLLMIFVIMLASSNNLKKAVVPFKHGSTYAAGAIAFAAILTASMLYSVILQTIYPVEDNTNQSAIIEVTKLYPIFSLLVFAIIGPICEELTYRVGLFGFFKRINRVLAWIISILIFAFIHFDFGAFVSLARDGNNVPLVTELLNIPSYIIGASGLIFIYERYGFGASTFAHILNNSYSLIMIIISQYVTVQA